MTSLCNPLTSLIKHARDVVDESLAERALNGAAAGGISFQERLNPVLFAVLSAGRNSGAESLSEEDRAALWDVVCKLWVRACG
jgi:hypothetical protein